MRRILRKDTLAMRLTGTLIIALGILLAAKAFIQISLQDRFARQFAGLSGLQLSEALFGSLHGAMLANDRQRLHTDVRNIATRSENLRIRVFNKEGEIVFSSVADEEGTRVDLNSEACYGCHAADQPLAKLAPGERTRTFKIGGVPALGVIRPIENEPACSEATCHAHPAERRLLGVLDVTLTMTDLARTQELSGLLMFITAAVALALTVVIVVLVVRGAVHRPVRRLIATLEQLRRADYSARHPAERIVEFDKLGDAVNATASALQKANAELVVWAQTLERRVAAKTEELKHAQEQMLQVERMASLGKLAAVVAHEINNPLASVVTYSKLLLKRHARDGGTEADTEILEGIAEESARCGRIVSNLLLFARRTSSQPEPTDVNQIVKRVMFLLKHQMDLNSVQHVDELDETVRGVWCDPSQFQQALLALCVNALDAMRGGGTLTVRTHPHPPHNGVRVEVGDTGVGISEEVRTRIFEPFFTTKGEREGVGLGLGLAVVYGIVQHHNGQVDVESAPGAGTTFTVIFPGAPTDEEGGES